MIQYRFVSLAYVDSLYINEIRLFVPFARCGSPPSAPPGGHYGTSICPPLARRLPAACPPPARRLPAAPSRRLRRLISRSLRGLFYPLPTLAAAAAALRLVKVAHAPPCRAALQPLAAAPVCPQGGRPNYRMRLPAACPPLARRSLAPPTAAYIKVAPRVILSPAHPAAQPWGGCQWVVGEPPPHCAPSPRLSRFPSAPKGGSHTPTAASSCFISFISFFFDEMNDL